MIHIIEGRIGSGKTYWCVAYIVRKFFEWDERFQEYFPRSGKMPKIFTNVDGLKLGEIHDITNIPKTSSLRDFFAVDVVTGKLLNEELRNSIIIIDEAQGPSWFHRKYSDPAVFLFFQLHRHYGCEIFLCTQDVKSLSPELRELPEYHLKVSRQSLTMANRFKYRKYYDDEPGAWSFLKKDKRIFECYRSVTKGAEIQKVGSALTGYAVLFAFGILAVIIGGVLMKNFMFSGSRFAARNGKQAIVIKAPLAVCHGSSYQPAAAPSPVIVQSAVREIVEAPVQEDQDWHEKKSDFVGFVQMWDERGNVIKEKRVYGKRIKEPLEIAASANEHATSTRGQAAALPETIVKRDLSISTRRGGV